MDIPAKSAPGAWKRATELRAAGISTIVHAASGPHDHDGMDDGDEAGTHAHHDLHERLDGHDGRLDEHHERLMNLEKANAARED